MKESEPEAIISVSESEVKDAVNKLFDDLNRDIAHIYSALFLIVKELVKSIVKQCLEEERLKK